MCLCAIALVVNNLSEWMSLFRGMRECERMCVFAERTLLQSVLCAFGAPWAAAAVAVGAFLEVAIVYFFSTNLAIFSYFFFRSQWTVVSV